MRQKKLCVTPKQCYNNQAVKNPSHHFSLFVMYSGVDDVQLSLIVTPTG